MCQTKTCLYIDHILMFIMLNMSVVLYSACIRALINMCNCNIRSK